MSRLNVTGLPIPPAQYRADKLWPKFERAPESLDELRLRARRLRAARLPDSAITLSAIELSRLLDPDVRSWPNPENPANPVYVREQRINIIGGIWKAIDDYPDGDVFSFTLIPTGTKYEAGELYSADPVGMNRKLRAHLNRAGIKHAAGFLFIGIHGEFDPAKNTFRIHWHGVGVGSAMRRVLDKLRKLKAFRSRRSTTTDGAVDKPVRISKKPLTNLPASISYTVQSFWPGRWTGIDKLGNPIKQRSKHRIKEPHHSEYLLWLSQWQLQDLILMVGLRATKRGLKARK